MHNSSAASASTIMPAVCVVCFDECEQAVSCANAHHVCYSCCEQLVLTAAEKLAQTNLLEASSRDEETRLELSGRIWCPCAKSAAGACDAAPYADAVLACALPEHSFAQYVTARTLLPIAEAQSKAYEDAQATLQQGLGSRGKSADVSRRLLAKALKQQMPDLRQCARCSFGPVDHFACSDLSAHHGQEVSSESSSGEWRVMKIDNSCQRCGWFSPERADWQLWDGRLHEDVQVDGDEAEALQAGALEAAETEAAEAKAALKAMEADHAESAARERSLREAGERDIREIARQRKLVEEWKLEHARAQDLVRQHRAAEARRVKALQAAAMARMMEASSTDCKRLVDRAQVGRSTSLHPRFVSYPASADGAEANPTPPPSSEPYKPHPPARMLAAGGRAPTRSSMLLCSRQYTCLEGVDRACAPRKPFEAPSRLPPLQNAPRKPSDMRMRAAHSEGDGRLPVVIAMPSRGARSFALRREPLPPLQGVNRSFR